MELEVKLPLSTSDASRALSSYFTIMSRDATSTASFILIGTCTVLSKTSISPTLTEVADTGLRNTMPIRSAIIAFKFNIISP